MGTQDLLTPFMEEEIEAESRKSTCHTLRWGAWVADPVLVQLFSILTHGIHSPVEREG